MAKVGDYEFYDFQDSVKQKFEVRVTVDANGSSTGFIKKVSDEKGNYIYNHYNAEGTLSSR